MADHENTDWTKSSNNDEKSQTNECQHLRPIIKNFYKEDPQVTAMSVEEVARIRLSKNKIQCCRLFKPEEGTDDSSFKVPNPVTTFKQAFRDYPEILRVLERQYEEPTPIQCQAWPILLSGKDMIGIVRGGTGTTDALLLPALIHTDGQIALRKVHQGTSTLVMVPTTQVALQFRQRVNKFDYREIEVCDYGDEPSRKKQSASVARSVDIVIATPNKLNDLMMNGSLNLSELSYLVLVETDRMLALGFEPQIREILANARPDRQTVFTTRWPYGVRRLAQMYMNDPIQVSVGFIHLSAVHSVKQTVLMIEDSEKTQKLREFFQSMDKNDKVIVFFGAKSRVDSLASELTLAGVNCRSIHDDREQTLHDLKTGEVKILLATDVASRGIDIEDVTHVFNYDFPHNIDEYFHCVSCTGRAGSTGKSISLFTHNDSAMAEDLITILKEAAEYVPDELHWTAQRYASRKEYEAQEKKTKRRNTHGSGSDNRYGSDQNAMTISSSGSLNMEESSSSASSDSYYQFLYFTQQKDTGLVTVRDENAERKLILPRHPETNDLDIYYLQSMLTYFDASSSYENEILDAFPVVSLAKDKDDKFYKLSLARLREFLDEKIQEDEYIRMTLKHLFMYRAIEDPRQFGQSTSDLLDGCLSKVNPLMYARNESDKVDCEDYELHRVASYVPTSRFSRMKLLRGWIEGALHYYNYSIMFFDNRFAGFDDFNENIIDIKSSDLFIGAFRDPARLNMKAHDQFMMHVSGLYYSMYLGFKNLSLKWLYTSPNNDNERDGKVMMFRNNDLRSALTKILKTLFRDDTYHINHVFKWNYYQSGGNFNTHYDTMFVKKSTEECSMYTLLVYLRVKGESFMFLGDSEYRVKLESERAYVIPHWVKHRVEGTGMREFIKTEIIFPNEYHGVIYDQSLTDAFDRSCYYMLQSVRHPQLKDIVSRSFNTINEARFYKTTYQALLENNIFIHKAIRGLPLKYHSTDGSLVTANANFDYITDGNYYYFKVPKKSERIDAKEAFVMLSLMQLDIQPKKMFMRKIDKCECNHEECAEYEYVTPDLDIHEVIAHWTPREHESKIAEILPCVQMPGNLVDVISIGNVVVPDIYANPETFYFAACQNIYDTVTYYQTRLTEITACGRDGNYGNLNVSLIGQQKNIVKIRQHSFGNGVRVKDRWASLSHVDYYKFN